MTNSALSSGRIVISPRRWKLFIRKNIAFYVLTNVVFNSLIPYFNFENPEAVYLFKGQYCLARFLLPLALFIPFLITIDTCNKTIALLKKESAFFAVPGHFSHRKFMFRSAGINGLTTFLIITGLMAFTWLLIPPGYTFNGLVLSILMGVFAGFIAVFFMMRTIMKLKCPEKLGLFHE